MNDWKCICPVNINQVPGICKNKKKVNYGYNTEECKEIFPKCTCFNMNEKYNNCSLFMSKISF